jgi:hypothetical protein
LSSAVSIDSAGRPAGSKRLGARPRAATRSPWWVELLVVGWLLFLYDAVNNLAPLRMSIALGNARGILHVERVLHIDPELSLDRWLASHHTLATILANYYDNAHFIVTLSVLGWLWWRRADIYRPLRNALVLVNVIGFVVFWLLPVAPPRMLGGFTDVVASTHAFGSWHTGALASAANQLAAMPSLHMAWAAWCTLALWRASRNPAVRALAVAYPCLTALAVLATGNHFLLDIVGGLIALALAVWLADHSGRLRRHIAPSWPTGLSLKRRSKEPAKPALRMSQGCYEVQDAVD